MTSTSTSEPSPAVVVRAFYNALIDGDPEAIGAIATASFAEDMTVDLPASLPYGGRVVGARRLAKMFRAMATGPADVGPHDLVLEGLVDGGDVVVARVSFGYRLAAGNSDLLTGALEEWTFVDGKVAHLRAYYADTAMLLVAP